MSGAGWARRRFWTEVSVIERPGGGGFGVALDGRVLRTPGKRALHLPTRALAGMVAGEWAAQGPEVRPQTMPATRSANTAIDRVADHMAQVAAEVTGYGGSDLLCYRASDPPGLVARQAAAWDPLLDWAAGRYGVEWRRITGVMPEPQPAPTLARLGAEVTAFDPFRLTALHELVALSGSLVIGLAAAQPGSSAESLWAASRVDEDWQAEQWGQDDEAAVQADARRAGFLNAHAFLHACG